MNKFTFILVAIFIISLVYASAQYDLPLPPTVPDFGTPDTQQEPETQTPQVTATDANLQNLQQLQIQVSSLQSTINTLNSENERMKQELRLQAERKPRATTFFYIVFFASLALNIILIAIYLIRYTKHHKPEFTFEPEQKKEEPAKDREIAELKKYLMDAARQGTSFDDVHDILRKAGWPEELIEKAYDEIQHGL